MLPTLCLNPVLVSCKDKKDQNNANSIAHAVFFSSLSLQESRESAIVLPLGRSG
jgi:hypothetical protein